MGNYLNNIYGAVEGVLLTYNGNDVSLKIPKRLGDSEINTVGNAAFMESQSLQQIIIPDSVNTLGRKAFFKCGQLMNAYFPSSVVSFGASAFGGCPRLANMYFYGVALKEQSYRDLMLVSRRVNGTVYLSQTFPYFGNLRAAVESTDASPANYVPSGIKRLFTSYSLEEERGEAALYRNLDSFGFDSDEKIMTEMSEFARLIDDSSPEEIDLASEDQNDQYLRSESFPKIEKTAVFYFDDSGTKLENGIYYIFGAVKIGYHFFQSKIPVVCRDRTYYIYRRHYLSRLPNLNYIRRDVAVFRDKDLVKDRSEAKEVYAKYRLLSIL